MIKILTVPHKMLRTKCNVIAKITPPILAVAKDLCEAMDIPHEGIITIGLSAPQIGKLVRMIAYRPNPQEGSIVIIINPVVVSAKNKFTSREGCLSLPGQEFNVARHKIVKVRGLNIAGEERVFKGRGLTAAQLEHEIDHLDGIMIDKSGLSPMRW